MPAFMAINSKAVDIVVVVNEEDFKAKVVVMDLAISPDIVNFSKRKEMSKKLLVS